MKLKLYSTLIIVFLSFTFSNIINSQTFKNTAFNGGEKLTYTGSYFMSGLWTNLAQIDMEVKAVKIKEKKLYKLNTVARTYSSWDSYFKVRDVYQSWVSPSSGKPYFFNRDVDEGGFKLKIRYVFSRKNRSASSTMTVNADATKKKRVPITSSTFDLTSALYYLRNIDYSKDKVGATHKITVLIDNELVVIYAKYRGKSKINVKGMGQKECYKVGIYLKEEKIMKNNAKNNIWLTADANKVPVLIKAVIPVGNIQIRLSKFSGLRN